MDPTTTEQFARGITSHLGMQDLEKVLLGAFAPFLVTLISYPILYVLGFNRQKQEADTLDLIKRRIEIVDTLVALGQEHAARYKVVQYAAIGHDIERFIHARCADFRFQAIKQRNLFIRYALMPIPKGVVSFLVTALYVYAALLVVLAAAGALALVVMSVSETSLIEVLLVIPLALFGAIVVAMAAGLRWLAFRLRRYHEDKRLRFDERVEATAAAMAAA